MRLPLYSYLVCVGLRPQDADDVVQDSFLRLHQCLQAGERISEPRAWLFRVGKNLSLNFCRDQRRLIYADDPYTHVQFREVPQSDHDPEAQYLKKEALLRLDAGIARLTESQQDCIHLRAQGLRYREIASVLGISVSSAAELLQRAIIRLAKDCQ
jgi:RNA polymerase sigma-70 factor (ECF subfamily)